MSTSEQIALCAVLILMVLAHLRAALRIRELKRTCRLLKKWCEFLEGSEEKP